ncbi:MAG TPA: ATP-binding protein [Rhodanobacteraceae bacterium]|nr:ATP-binding protein [Rhodanobacteraceae bacterium]
MRSLNGRISLLVLAALTLLLIPFGILSYLKTMEEVDELSDARLAQSARTITLLASDSGSAWVKSETPIDVENWRGARGDPEFTVHGHNYEAQIGFQYWGSDNRLHLTSNNLRDVALEAAPAGFSDIMIGGKHWRVFTLLGADRDWVRVAERYDSRREIARALALENAVPLLIGLPLLAILTGFAVRRGLRPLRQLAEHLAARRPDHVGPIGFADIPLEVEPLVMSLNGLLRRLRTLLEHERRFTADAAHELRTPLAGVVVQIDNALASAERAHAASALGQARHGIDRMSHTINQMLDLARWDAGPASPPVQAVDLARVVRAELAEINPRAIEKDLEIALDVDAYAPSIEGWEPGVAVLVRNIVDNAVAHSPPHGRIDIAIRSRDGTAVLAVSDQGPGIPAELRTRVFARFRRGIENGEGSGLGLAIVARIAELHGAEVRLGDSRDGGLRIEVAFPLDMTVAG